MKIRAGRLCAFTLVSLLSVFGLATQAMGQGYIFNQMSYFQPLDPPSNTSAIAQGDFNGDGQLDFAVASCDYVNFSNNYYIGIYLAQSNGTYAMTSSYAIPGEGTYKNGGKFSVAVGDVNGDGKLDLIYTAIFNPPFGDPNWIVVQLGNGDGTFQTPIASVTSAAYPPEVILGDFNNDGKPDVALVDGYTDNIYVQLGNGDGTFQASVPYAVQGYPASVIAADFRNDGKLDLAVACIYNGQPCTNVFLGNGDGTFGAPTYYAAGGSGIAAADMNGDGKLDLVVSAEPSQNVSVLLGNGDGTFQTPISTPVAGNIGTLVTADLNGDGKIDVAMVGGWTGIVILLGNDNGTFKSPLYTYGSGSSEQPSSLLVGGYNPDGKT